MKTSFNLTKKALATVAGLAMVTASSLFGQETTTVTITDKVLLDRCKRFGINVNGDTAWTPILKARNRINFEGTAFRRVANAGPGCEGTTLTTFMLSSNWVEVISSAADPRYYILSGPSKGMSGKILGVTYGPKLARWADPKKLEQVYKLQIDQPIKGMNVNDGVLVEAVCLDDGQISRGEQAYYRDESGLTISHDVRKGSYGRCAMKMVDAEYTLRVGKTPRGRTNVEVTGSFWAKAGKSGAKLVLQEDKTPFQTINLTPEWTRYEFTRSVPAGQPKEYWVALKASGEVLMDDIMTDMGGDTNPTAFRDEFVAIMKDFNPGILRTLQMGGDSVENFLRPDMQRHAFHHRSDTQRGPHAGHGDQSFDVADYYGLCEYLGAEAWLNLPGTSSIEGFKKFMEFVGGPTNTEFGALRAQMKHPDPYTATLKGIHVEFGNEIWNFSGPYYGCGYNGPDFWHDLAATGKSSPWYKPNIIFNFGGRAFPNMPAPCVTATNADRFCWAPYILHSMTKEQETQLGSDTNLVRWGFARAINNAVGTGEMAGAFKAVKGVAPLAIYEISHHLMNFIKSDPKQGSVRARNVIQGTLAGGVNVANAMLMHLKYNGAFDQCYFGYNESGGKDFSTDMYGAWSSHRVTSDGRVVYNPCFLAISAINKVVAKNLLETVHEGAAPVFTGYDMKNCTPVPNQPELWTYAFREGKRRGFVVVSLNLEKPLPVVLKFNGKPKGGAQQYLVSGPSFVAENFTKEEVALKTTDLKQFQSGVKLSVPPCSMLALKWDEE